MALNLETVGKESEPMVFEYKAKDAILYALGIGAGRSELDFTYEKNLKVYPTFAVIPILSGMAHVIKETQANLMMLLHSEQKITLYKPIPPEGKLTTVVKVKNIYDKMKAALIVAEANTKDASGAPIFDNMFSFYIRGEGGFGGERGTSVKHEIPAGKESDFRDEMGTLDNQALIYRLSGDVNPLHIDPEFAKLAGFDRPILHGLCSFGFAGRAILKKLCDNDPARLKSFHTRFSGVVFPGDTIITEGWKIDEKKYVIQVKTQTGTVALSNALVELT